MTSSITIVNNEKVYHDSFTAGFNQGRRAVKTGCEVTESSPQAMSVDISAGEVYFDSSVSVVAGTIGLAIASASEDRMDLIVVDNTGTISVLDGTSRQSATDPRPPAFDIDDYVILARVYVDDGATVIENADIKDQRCFFTITPDANINKYVSNYTSGTSTITHNLNDSNPLIQVYDTSFNQILPNEIEIIDADTIYLDVQGTSGNIVIVGGSDSSPTGNSDIVPQSDNVYDIGSGVKRWQDGYFTGNVNVTTINSQSPAGFKSSSGTFNSTSTTTITIVDSFCEDDSLVTVAIDGTTTPVGVWSVESANGSFDLTSTELETEYINFDYYITRVI